MVARTLQEDTTMSERKRPALTFRRIQRAILCDNGTGFCTTCGKAHKYTEPDAEHYPCTKCKTPTVFGAEQILLLGLVSDV